MPPPSERLSFRRWTQDDLDLALGLWGDPRVTELLVFGGVFAREDIEARLALEIDNQRRYGVQYWPVFLRATGEHVGCAGLRPYDADPGVFEIGFHLKSAFWGQGLAAEAARAVIRFAFDDVGARALFAGHHPRNASSRALLTKLGFRHTHDELYTPTGLGHPSYRLEAPGS